MQICASSQALSTKQPTSSL